jgi:hypothetical protein
MSNRRTVAMDVNDDVGNLTPRGALGFIASRLAPTGAGDRFPQVPVIHSHRCR